MAIGKRRSMPQQALFVATSEISASANPFYGALDKLLREDGFDEFAEEVCGEFYAGNVGRPGIPPGVYFRMLMVGYLEGISSERGIAWRCRDSFSLREFLGYGLTGNPPDHSSLSKTRKRLSLEAHAAVFARVLGLLEDTGLLGGGTLGVDSTTLEANAAMRSIVRRDGGTGYEEWLRELARASGIETPTREELAKLDRKRPKKGSNAEWVHPGDPEARITKMKDGRTRLGHKLEQAVDLESGAVVGVTVQTTDGGDVASLSETLDEAEQQLAGLGSQAAEVVCDKGYHSNKRKRNEEARKPVYANRRRIRGERGQGLLRLRGEKLERSFAHLLETGGLRRVHVRGHEDIRKRLLIHAAAFNLGLLMRKRCGVGTPRGLQGRPAAAQAVLDSCPAPSPNPVFAPFSALLGLARAVLKPLSANSAPKTPNPALEGPFDDQPRPISTLPPPTRLSTGY